jgi:hypothetical protein
VSVAPSRTCSAELTVLVRKHSSTPATSTTAFFHVAVPNKSRNGRSKRSTSLPPLSVSRRRAAQLARCLLDALARLSVFGITFLFLSAFWVFLAATFSRTASLRREIRLDYFNFLLRELHITRNAAIFQLTHCFLHAA